MVMSDDCVITDNDITGRRWVIGRDPVTDGGGWVATVDPAGDLLPHEIKSWKYIIGGKWQSETDESQWYSSHFRVKQLTNDVSDQF